jgi:hypothetical protein
MHVLSSPSISPAISLRILLLFVIACVPATAAGRTPCERLEQALMRIGDPDPAECLSGASLESVHATLPKGLRIAAVRGLYVDDGSAYRSIDPRQNAIDLDREDANGNSIAGALWLSGRLTLSGRLRYEQNNGWHWIFVPDQPLGDEATAFHRAMATIALDRDDSTPWAMPPASLAGESCWEVSATARISDVVVLMGDSELAGMQPMSVRLSKVRDFRACAPSESIP